MNISKYDNTMKLLLITLILFTTNIYANQWKHIATEDGIEILSLPAKDGVLPFKAVGVINTDLESLVKTLTDHTTKHLWAPKLEKVILHQKLKNQTFIFSEYYKTPWPATDREFLLKGHVNIVDKNTVTLKASSVENDDNFRSLASESHIQASVKYINLILKRVSKQKTQIQFEFHGDMKGWMPLWLMNLIQKKWPLRFIQGLRQYSVSPEKK